MTNIDFLMSLKERDAIIVGRELSKVAQSIATRLYRKNGAHAEFSARLSFIQDETETGLLSTVEVEVGVAWDKSKSVKLAYTLGDIEIKAENGVTLDLEFDMFEPSVKALAHAIGKHWVYTQQEI